MSCMIVSPI